jgi:hypothetical protein
MGFIKGSLKVVSNIVTLGGASRLDDAKAHYQVSYAEHEQLCADTKVYKDQIEAVVSAIGSSLTATRPLLAKSEKILKKSISKKNILNFSHTLETLDSVEKFNSEYNAAIGIGTGTIAGGSLAVGSWALVGALGSASTGAAISGLSGVVATNATLAWFGGGALAAGGAGMTGGIAMLGGIVAVPLIALASVGTHKKAKEFEEEKIKLDKTIVEQKQHLSILPDLLNTTEEKRIEIDGLCDGFKSTSRRLIKIIRPFGILSALKQKILMLLRLKPFTQAQIEALDQLSVTVSDFLETFQNHGAAA